MKKLVIILLSGLFVFSTQLACSRSADVVDSLTQTEKNSLQFMREEEKLAHDVYIVLYEKWNLLPFFNIAQSELSHMEAVRTLLYRYEIPDPVEGKAAGEFVDQTLQQLYYTLVQKGNISEIEALTVGAMIEEIDIRDLEEQLADITRTDIVFVYENLMRGSRNHLRSFVQNLSLRGVTYVPQYLSVDEYNSIINSGMEKGGRW
ncbi:MAG TPA: DUF2202 domain-containing protein [Chitinophagaceae bacterium]|nr:DUF2202 domain-containing protein [Chitinophagaceae bacterium]HPG11301.1 DUF2202 domain-containing protein [Chitinophagaceae bacterium]